MQRITENVYVETGFGGSNNTFVVTSEGIVMIDTPQSPEDAVKWKDEIAKHGEVQYIINSEPHGDHFTGNYFFDGMVVAHDGVREAILASNPDQFRQQMKQMAPNTTPIPDDFYYKAPVITFSQKLTLHLGDHTFELTNLPGHTPYQTAIYIPEEKVVCTSDNVVNGVQPFLHQAVPYQWLESLKRYQEYDAEFLVPGHGEVCTPDYLPEMSKMVQAWIDAAKEAINKGMTAEQIQEDTSLLKKYGIKVGTEPFAKRVVGMSMANLIEKLK
jgi:cyclase